MAMQTEKNAAGAFVDFLNKSVSPFHAVHECTQMLTAAGYQRLNETEQWNLTRGGKYFVTRNKSAVMAFEIGGKYAAGNGFSIVAAHTDSPCLRVKPVSKLSSAGVQQVGVSTYGGGLWRTWFDRDLSVAGRLFVRNGAKVEQKLVRVDKTLLYLPSLCIHLDTNRDSFAPNKETELRPLVCTEAANKLNAVVDAGDGDDVSEMCRAHHTVLLSAVAHAAQVQVGDIVDFELYLYDVQPAAIGGAHDEFIAGARLDNLVGTYTAVRALIDAQRGADDAMVRVAACYDNEECGSQSAQGAGSAITQYVLRRIHGAFDAGNAAFEQAMAKSYLVSADQAHAVHPNYESKHEGKHRPQLHGGIVVKVNTNQRYATTGLTHAILREVATKAAVPLQKVVVRNDSPCGSTIGPMMSASMGMRTIDVGTPQWAMHSVRELCCTSGIEHARKLYKGLYEHCAAVMDNIELE